MTCSHMAHTLLMSRFALSRSRSRSRRESGRRKFFGYDQIQSHGDPGANRHRPLSSLAAPIGFGANQ
jgi:hypothetical protein